MNICVVGHLTKANVLYPLTQVFTMSETPKQVETKQPNFVLPIILTLVILGAFVAGLYFFLQPKSDLIPDIDPALDSLNLANAEPTEEELAKQALILEIQADSTEAMTTAQNFFLANQEKDKSLLESALSDSIYQYPVLPFTNKKELITEIEKYWYLVTDEQNVIDTSSITFFSKKEDLNLSNSYVTFDIHYTADAKQGPLDLNFAVKMELDEYHKVIAYATERL